MTPSFDFAALKFLMLWERVEKPLHSSLAGSARAEDIRLALKHFQISRSFAGVRDDFRALAIVELLEEINADSRLSPEEKVTQLTESFARTFKKRNQSAASKLMWLRFRSPYVVFDSRAVAAVKRLADISKFPSYASYVEAWRGQFEKVRPKIELACSRLASIQSQVENWREDAIPLRQLVNQQWFVERVFDIHLWEFGGNDGQPSHRKASQELRSCDAFHGKRD